MRPPLSILCALLAAGLVLAGVGCSESGLPCGGGCPTGLVCDLASDQCVELRPPEGPPDVGRWASLAVDTTGRVLLASYVGQFGDLVYGRPRSDGAYEFEYVDGVPNITVIERGNPPLPVILGDDVGRYCSLVLDPLDRPHIAYFDSTHGKLKYATRTPEGWTVIEVPRAGEEGECVGRAASLVLDADGLPHIAYLAEGRRSVMLARKSGDGRWAIEQVSQCADPGPWPESPALAPGRAVALVLDRQGVEWVVFREPCGGGLQVATRKSGGWQVTTLDASPTAATWLSAALDPGGNVAVAYFDRSSGALLYAYNKDGSPRRLVADEGLSTGSQGGVQRAPVGQHAALAFGYDGRPRILYLDGAALELKLLVGTASGGFEPPQVALDQRPVGFFNALVRLPAGGLRAASYRYRRDENGLSDGELLWLELDGGVPVLGGGR